MIKRKEMTSEQMLDYLIEQLKAESEYSDALLPQTFSLEEKQNLLRAFMNVRMPQIISEEFLHIQDLYLKQRALEKGIVRGDELECITDNICIWQGDITRLETDAIVNAANSGMLGCFVPLHNCIDNCIHTYAGIELRSECEKKMKALKKLYGNDYEQPTAVPILTGAYNLPAKKIIHIVGPIVLGKLSGEHEELLCDCYRNCLNLCLKNNLKSIAFCCISTGVFHFPAKRAATLAVKTVRNWLEDNPHVIDRVIFNVFRDEDKSYYEELLK